MPDLKRNATTYRRWLQVGLASLIPALALADEKPGLDAQRYRGLLGSSSKKIKIENGKTFLWAGGAGSGPKSQWYDFTGSPIPAADLQFGIGKDRIKSIDDPLFVSPDDPRLLSLDVSPYRPAEEPKKNDEIMIIGIVEGEDARAYPVALLDHHELVNDAVAGKPVTVGW
ncbi:MAG: DUF3179 domain-containing protein [Phycisphaerales bacterium]|nr:MAG: DUF3179 domain-containing protein [Phycisphaerales bacterium]